MFSVLACTLFVSVDDKLVSILPYHRKANGFRGFPIARAVFLSSLLSITTIPLVSLLL
ncbi:hypothetical protein AALB19_16865 [Oscillospiraceae bacterium 50-58]